MTRDKLVLGIAVAIDEMDKDKAISEIIEYQEFLGRKTFSNDDYKESLKEYSIEALEDFRANLLNRVLCK